MEDAIHRFASSLGLTVKEDYPGVWVVYGPGVSQFGHATASLDEVQHFLEGFAWGRAWGAKEQGYA